MDVKMNSIKKLILILLIIGFILSMFPLIYISKLNHPYRDDFSYSILTHNAFIETGSFIEVIRIAAQQVRESYFSWQGTYSSVFLFALNPALFSDEVYVFTAILLFSVFISSNLILMHAILVKCLKISKTNYFIISITIIIISIQLLPSAFDAFYWYNGGIHYVFFYSLSLVLYALFVEIIINNSKTYFYVVFGVLLSVVIGGGNFVTALNTAIILLLCLIYLFFSKRKNWQYILLLFIVLMIGMMVSILAPGNEIRSSNFQGYSPIKSILNSIKFCSIYIYTMFSAPKGYFLLVLLPLLSILPFMSKVIANPRFKFRYPGLVVLMLFLVLSSMFTPQFYGLGDKGPIRVENIIFFSFILYMFITMVYISGYLYTRIMQYIKIDTKSIIPKTKIYIIYLSVIVILFSSCLYSILSISKNRKPTSIQAIVSILNREVYDYHAQNIDRLRLLESDEKEVKLNPITAHPPLLSTGDFVDERYEAYYNKNSVEVIEDSKEAP